MEKVPIERKVHRRPELELNNPSYQRLNKSQEKPRFINARHFDQDFSSLTHIQADTERKSKINSKLILLSELEKKLNIELSKSTITQISDRLENTCCTSFDCSVQELHMTVKRLSEIIRNYENFKIIQGIFYLGKQEISLSINNQDTAIADKKEIQTVLLNSIQNQIINEIDDIPVPFYCVEALSCYEADLYRAFEENINGETCKEQVKCVNRYSGFIAEQQSSVLRQTKLEHAVIKYDLDWQKEEFKLLKTQLKCKRNEVANKELDLNKRYKNLRENRLSMAHESEVFEKKIENFEEKKELLSQIIDKIRDLIKELTLKSGSPKKDLPPEICINFLSTQDEINQLELDLKALETQFKRANAVQAESLQTQIYRVKTKISSLKSINMLNNTFQSAKSAKNIMQNFTKVYSVRSACHHRTTGGFASNKASPLNSSAIFNFSQIERESVKSIEKQGRSTSVSMSDLIETLDSDKDKKTSMNYKESRLAEKEEELRRKEEKLVKALEKIGTESEVEVIKEEIVNLSRVKRFYESRQKQLENKFLESDKVRDRLKEKEKDLQKKFDEIEELNSKLKDDRNDILLQLESMKLFIEENLSDL